MGDPMSDTEVDGTPDDVEERDDGVAYSHDEGQAADWVRSALIVVPLVIGLLVVAGMGARMLLADIPDPGTDPTTAETVVVRCWDGALKPDEGCPVPDGRAGLRWVFPSFRPNELDCRNALVDFPKSTRPSMYACEVEATSGPATVVYSQLTQVARGRASFEQLYGGEGSEVEGDRRLLWTEGDDPGADGDYELAVMYAALPFAVEVSAASAEARDEALESLIKFRPADDVMDHS